MIKPKNILSVPRLSGEWTPGMASQLTETLKQLLDQMTGGIVETVHTHSRYVEATFTAPTPTAGVRVASGLSARPATVELVEFAQIRPTFAPASLAASLEWTWDRGTIVLPQFGGIAGSAQYTIKLLVREAD